MRARRPRARGLRAPRRPSRPRRARGSSGRGRRPSVESPRRCRCRGPPLAARGLPSTVTTGPSCSSGFEYRCSSRIRSSSSAEGYPSAVLRKKRSSCASGNGNVPSYSTGFSVASRRNGSGSARVTPSTVTCCSAIASRSADCVFGIARLTSSTSTTFAKIGPCRNSNSRVFWSKIASPVTSVGWRSGVHWMREVTAPSIERAIVRASTVFPVPGTSSSRTCPPQVSAARTSRISSDLPWMTVSMLPDRRSAIRTARSRADSCVERYRLRVHRRSIVGRQA